VHGVYGSPKAPLSPSAAAVSARRATSNSKQVSGQLAERLARLRAEEDEVKRQLEEARSSEEEICSNSEKRLLHHFIPEETIKTPISHTGVAVASSASSTRPQLVQTPRQRVPTEKMERLGIETSPDELESRQGEADWAKRKETETERAAEVAVDTQADHGIKESSQPTGAFTLPLETITMPISYTRVAVTGVAATATSVSSASASRSPDGATEVIEDSDHAIMMHSVVSMRTFASPSQQVRAADVTESRSASPRTEYPDPLHSAASREAGAVVGTDTAQSSPVYTSYVTNLRSRLLNLTKERDGGLKQSSQLGVEASGQRLLHDMDCVGPEPNPWQNTSSLAEPVGAATVTDSDTHESHGVRQSSITLARMESALVMESPMANYHEEHTVEEAERQLDPWFRQIGFAEDDVKILVLRFSKPDFGVTNCALMFSLEDEDVDVILEGCPLGHKRAIKRALKKGKNA